MHAGHLQCPTEHVAMHESLRMTDDIKDLRHVQLSTRLLRQNLLIASNYPRISSSSCCLLLFSVDVINTLTSASVRPSPSITFDTVMILFLGSGLGFLTGALFPNFQKTVNRELIIMAVQQLEDVLSIVHTKFLVWLNPYRTNVENRVSS